MQIVEPDWSVIVRETSPALLRYFCGSFARAQAADLVQETLIRLVQKQRAGAFSSDKGSFKSYALGIARYVRLEALKNLAPTELLDEDQASTSGAGSRADFSASPRDEIRDLRRAIAKLKPVEQEIILLSIDADLSLDEIAEIIKMPVGTVKSHVHRAKENLKVLLEVKS